MNGQRYAQITGWGMCVPEKVVTNEDLSRVVDTTDEWIYSITGIQERRIVADDKESTATLATRAAREALLVAAYACTSGSGDRRHGDARVHLPIDGIAGAGCARRSQCGRIRPGAGCSGFIYALSLAANVIRSGSAEHVLVIGSETLSRIVDWTDRNTCVLFGDGAGAVVVSACDEGCGVLASVLGSDGSGGELLIVPAGGSRCPTSHETVRNGDHFIKMNGREVFRFATTIMPKATEAVVKKAGWQMTDLSFIIPHQANSRIIESAIKRLGLPKDRFFVNVDRYGNTSAASIPIALCEAITEDRIHPGDKLVLVGFGAGLTWAAAAVKWGVPQPVRRPVWFRRLIASLVFGSARARSWLRRTERRAYDRLMGPEGSERPARPAAQIYR